MTGQNRYRRATLPALGAALLTFALLTGCGADAGSGGDNGDKSSEGATAGGTDDAEGAPSSASPDGGEAPSGTNAADGKDLDACADAECEVQISVGDVLEPDESHGVQQFTVEQIRKGVVSWRAVFTTGSAAMRSRGASVSETSCTGGECNGRLGKGRGRLETDKLTLDFTDITEDTAVVRVKARK